MANYFSHAQHPTVGDHASFQNVAGNSTITTNHNYNNSQNEDRMIVSGRMIRRVMDSDIHCLRLLSSEILSVPVKQEAASTSSKLQVIKLKKMVQTAEIFGCPGRYTATTLEPVNREDQDICNEIVDGALRVAVCHRSAMVTQVFAVAKSPEAFTMLSFDELASGGNVSSLYWNKNWILYHYLHYTHGVAVQCLHNDEALPFPVANRWMDWSINLKTLTWYYNPASLSLNSLSEINLSPLSNPYPPLCQENVPPLNSSVIVAHVEETFGDFLYLIGSQGGRWAEDLSNYAQNGLLTFGAVVNYSRPGIFAHFPSTPPPKSFCQSLIPNVKASYSASGRVDFTFQKTGTVKVHIDIGLCIPYNDQIQLRAAYLCQSLHFCDGCSNVLDLVCIDTIGFCLGGIFLEDPTTRATPAYLFVPPLCTELISDMHCVRYPFHQSQFYWSSDLYGRDKIAEEDWERLGIPELSVQGLIGSWWSENQYPAVWEVLRFKGYDLDGKQYAHDHGYPELVLGDPHDAARFRELPYSESDLETKTPSSPSQLTLQPTSSYLEPEAPASCDTGCEASEATSTLPMDCAPTHWAKPRFLKKWYNVVSQTITQAQADDLDYSVAVC
ncbi:hypothetical protein PQX77_019368 [Marasmius sp. AFHP31]|nr:hypothetical protein PQX77_019368 [Marasmius sp. AFHP31]